MSKTTNSKINLDDLKGASINADGEDESSRTATG